MSWHGGKEKRWREEEGRAFGREGNKKKVAKRGVREAVFFCCFFLTCGVFQIGSLSEGVRMEESTTRRPTAGSHVTGLKVIGCDIVRGLMVLLRHRKQQNSSSSPTCWTRFSVPRPPTISLHVCEFKNDSPAYFPTQRNAHIVKDGYVSFFSQKSDPSSLSALLHR